MHLFAVDPWWSDFFTVVGFIFGVLGFIVGVGGFWIAIRQIKKTKRAAEAAEDAAKRTLAESKESYERFVGAYASRLLSELQGAVNATDWKLAAVRAHDLAELFGTLRRSREPVREMVTELRIFGQKFAERAAGNAGKYARAKWIALLANMQTQLDTLRSPFRDEHHAEIGSDNPQADVPADRSDPPGEDEGRSGELGPQANRESRP